MNRNYIQSLFIGLVLLMIYACKTDSVPSKVDEEQMILENSLTIDRKDEVVQLDLAKWTNIFGDKSPEDINFSTPFQFNDNDQDGMADELILLFDLKAEESRSFSISELLTEEKSTYAKRTQAEISHKVEGEWKEREYMDGRFVNVDHLDVPPEHTDHSWYIRYEGPGWESDKVGYRFYLDWRNATDIFGKKTTDMVLQDVGQDGFDSYHEPSDWGMDVLKVGSSLGVGSIGMWVDGKAERVAETDSLKATIVSNGIIQSKVRTRYFGWKINGQQVDLTSDISINAGSRLTHQEIQISENVTNLCTGIVKHEVAEVISKAQNGVSGWGYLATYGKQSLADDNLGMAILFKNDDLIELTEDEHSQVVVLKPKHKSLEYYFLAAWEQEPGGITNNEEFIKYLDETVDKLNNPIYSENGISE